MRRAHTQINAHHGNPFTPQRQAEARANPRSSGLVINQATSVTYAGDLYPAPRSSSGTENAQQRAGRLLVKSGQMGLPMNTFGTVAQATVDTDRALCVAVYFLGWGIYACVEAPCSITKLLTCTCFILSLLPSSHHNSAVSASEALPVMPYGPCIERRCKDSQQGVDKYSYGRASYALGSTTTLFEQRPLRSGNGLSRVVFTDSISANSLPPLSAGISGAGGGPLSVAAAGDAVAMANADALKNGGMQRRRRRQRRLLRS
jgi:hypothetical protein